MNHSSGPLLDALSRSSAISMLCCRMTKQRNLPCLMRPCWVTGSPRCLKRLSDPARAQLPCVIQLPRRLPRLNRTASRSN